MAASRDVSGVIEAALPRGLYRVRTDGGEIVVVSPSAAAKRVLAALRPGERVSVRRSPHDPTRGFIESKER